MSIPVTAAVAQKQNSKSLLTSIESKIFLNLNKIQNNGVLLLLPTIIISILLSKGALIGAIILMLYFFIVNCVIDQTIVLECVAPAHTIIFKQRPIFRISFLPTNLGL